MYVMVLVTCPDEKSAENIANIVLQKRLGACVNALAGITSKYWWRGKIEKSSEVLLLIKTKQSLVQKIEKIVKENHPYEVPEVIALPISAGSKKYLNWIEKETGK